MSRSASSAAILGSRGTPTNPPTFRLLSVHDHDDDGVTERRAFGTMLDAAVPQRSTLRMHVCRYLSSHDN